MQLVDVVLEEVTDEKSVTTVDLCRWHQRWLGNVYDWAAYVRFFNNG